MQIAIYSGAVGVGLGVLRNTDKKLLPLCFLGGMSCGGIFYILYTKTGVVFLSALSGAAVAAIFCYISSHKNKHDCVFLIIPSIYCIAPGAPMYRLFFYLIHSNFIMANKEFIYICQIIAGCMVAIWSINTLYIKFADKNVSFDAVNVDVYFPECLMYIPNCE